MPIGNRIRSQPGEARGDLPQTHAAAFRAWQRTSRRREPAPAVAEDVEHDVRELLYGGRSGHLRVAHSDRIAPGDISREPAGRSSDRPRG
jgi:hypothetical protein